MIIIILFLSFLSVSEARRKACSIDDELHCSLVKEICLKRKKSNCDLVQSSCLTSHQCNKSIRIGKERRIVKSLEKEIL